MTESIRQKALSYDAVNTLLTVLSSYRKKDPSEADEEEKLENLFDALCSLLIEADARSAFKDAEGPELMFMMLK